MGTTLHTLAPNKGATKTKKRLGRGRGSGTGKTSGKGVKGQKARAGHHGARIGFEGGQMPMKMRIGKRGFKNPFRVQAHPINLKTLEEVFDAGATVDVEALAGGVQEGQAGGELGGRGPPTSAITPASVSSTAGEVSETVRVALTTSMAASPSGASSLDGTARMCWPARRMASATSSRRTAAVVRSQSTSSTAIASRTARRSSPAATARSRAASAVTARSKPAGVERSSALARGAPST